MCLFEKLGIISVLNGGLVAILDYGSKGGFVGIFLSRMNDNVLHGSEVFGGTFNDFVFEGWESIDRGLALFFWFNWFGVKNRLCSTHLDCVR